MKIAIFTELFWPYVLGGGENRYYEIAKRLARKHEVHVYTMKLRDVKDYEIHENIHIHRLGILRHPLEKRSLKPLALYFIHSLLKELPNINIIDCNTYFPCISGFIKSKLKRKPIIATIHDVYRGQWGQSLGKSFISPVGDFIESVVCKLSYDKIISVSSSTKNLLIKTFSVPEDRIETVPNGINTNLIDKIKTRKVRNQICYVGRLVPHKHVEDLIKVVSILRKRIPNVKCKIVGGGFLKDAIEKNVKEMMLEKHIEVMGHLQDYKDVIKIIKESEVFVLPSTREGFGIVMLEAMRCKTAPVAYKLDAYKDFCNNENSILVEERNVEKLSNAIRELLTDEEKRKRIVQRSFKTAEMFDWNRIVNMVEKTYETLL